MSKTHTPEPWVTSHGASFLPAIGSEGTKICDLVPIGEIDGHFYPEAEANAERIVACVNACAGFSAQELETLGHFKAMHETIVAENEKLRAQLAGRRSMYDRLVKQLNDMKAALAARIGAPLLSRQFKYLNDGLAWINREKIEVLTIMDAGRFSEGVHVIYREKPARKEASHE